MVAGVYGGGEEKKQRSSRQQHIEESSGVVKGDLECSCEWSGRWRVTGLSQIGPHPTRTIVIVSRIEWPFTAAPDVSGIQLNL